MVHVKDASGVVEFAHGEQKKNTERVEGAGRYLVWTWRRSLAGKERRIPSLV